MKYTKEQALEIINKVKSAKTKDELNKVYEEVGGRTEIHLAVIKHYEDDEIFVKLICDEAKDTIKEFDNKHFTLNNVSNKPINAGSDDYIAIVK
jgi:protoheme ferro-lyase